MTLVHALPAAKLQSNKNTHDIRKRNLYSLFFSFFFFPSLWCQPFRIQSKGILATR